MNYVNSEMDGPKKPITGKLREFFMYGNEKNMDERAEEFV